MLFSFDPVFLNFSSTVTVNSFLMSGDTLFAASSGGLQVHNVKSGAAELLSNAKMFPDPHLTALCRDAKGNLWMGSQKGYLYKRTPRGQFSVFSNYKLADWGILYLYTHNDLIIVGSNRGVSIFDPQRGTALRNAAAIGNFSNPQVNAITVFKDTLFLGCEEGIAYIDGLHNVPLSRRNFYDATIWKTEESTEPAVSFVHTDRFVSPQATPSALFNGGLVTSDDEGWILYDGERWKRVTSSGKIVTIYNENDRRLWIGTDEMYYFSFNGYDNPQQHRIEGLALRTGTRIMAAPNGDVWVLPRSHHQSIMWHHAVYRYDGRSWHSYSGHTHGEGFGYMGDREVLGMALGKNNTLWVGTWGGNVKHIDPAANTVGQLVIGYGDFSNVNYMVNGVGDNIWGKSDALAMDSTGFLWIAAWGHDLGSLICYDPRHLPVSSAESDPSRAHYRRFFTEHPLKTLNISELNVDAQNRIFAFDQEQSTLTIFKPNENPLTDGIEIIASYPQIGTVSAIRSADDGTTYISASSGLRRVRAEETALETVDAALTNVTSIAIQGNVLWLGTRTDGVLRYDLSGAKRWINESAGLLSNNVLGLSMDNKNGHLWILTDGGVSRLDAGREVKVTSKEPLRVFPNVFSIGGRAQGASSVTFARLESRSVVSIYAINGVLVDNVNAQLCQITDEWRAFWVPKRTLAPGTYLAVVKPSGKKAKIILKP